MQAIHLDHAEEEEIIDLPTEFDELVDAKSQESVRMDLERIARQRREAAVEGAPVRLS